METRFTTFPVTETDFVMYFQKTSGPGREEPNFLFSGFTLADRAGKKSLRALLRTVVASADHAEKMTGRKAIHNLVLTPVHRLLFINTFGIKFAGDFVIVPSLKISADFDAKMPMQKWGWFEAAIKYAIEAAKK